MVDAGQVEGIGRARSSEGLDASANPMPGSTVRRTRDSIARGELRSSSLGSRTAHPIELGMAERACGLIDAVGVVRDRCDTRIVESGERGTDPTSAQTSSW